MHVFAQDVSIVLTFRPFLCGIKRSAALSQKHKHLHFFPNRTESQTALMHVVSSGVLLTFISLCLPVCIYI